MVSTQQNFGLNDNILHVCVSSERLQRGHNYSTAGLLRCRSILGASQATSEQIQYRIVNMSYTDAARDETS